VEPAVTNPAQSKAYRRYNVGSAILAGVVMGIGLGGVVALTGQWWWMLVGVGLPVGIRVVGFATRRLVLREPVAWIWPIVAFLVALPIALVVPSSMAPFALGFAVALWFVLIVAIGIIDVAVDPDGRRGSP